MRKRINPYNQNLLKVFVRSESLCEECPFRGNKRVWGEGEYFGNIIICGEAPGADEDKQGRPFVGRAGKELDKALREVEIPRRNNWITNVLSCRPPENNFNHSSSVVARNKCYSGFQQEFNFLKSGGKDEFSGFKVIAVLGLNASRYFGIMGSMKEIHGKEFDWCGYKVIPTYHPSYIIRSHSKEIRDSWIKDLTTIRDTALLESV